MQRTKPRGICRGPRYNDAVFRIPPDDYGTPEAPEHELRPPRGALPLFYLECACVLWYHTCVCWWAAGHHLKCKRMGRGVALPVNWEHSPAGRIYHKQKKFCVGFPPAKHEVEIRCRGCDEEAGFGSGHRIGSPLLSIYKHLRASDAVFAWEEDYAAVRSVLTQQYAVYLEQRRLAPEMDEIQEIQKVIWTDVLPRLAALEHPEQQDGDVEDPDGEPMAE